MRGCLLCGRQMERVGGVYVDNVPYPIGQLLRCNECRQDWQDCTAVGGERWIQMPYRMGQQAARKPKG